MTTIRPDMQKINELWFALTEEQRDEKRAALADRIERVEARLASIAESYNRNMQYFVTALRDNGGTLEDRGVTTHSTRCDVCHCKQEKGIRRFWFSVPINSNGVPCGNESFHFHPCPKCLNAIHEAIAIPVEMPQIVTA